MGYSALRIARRLPEEGHVYSVEFSAAHAEIARRIIAHAKMSDRITVVVGHLGDGGKTIDALRRDPGFDDDGVVDFQTLIRDLVLESVVLQAPERACHSWRAPDRCKMRG